MFLQLVLQVLEVEQEVADFLGFAPLAQQLDLEL